MTTATAVDWSGVEMTKAAKNSDKPETNVRVVIVPRAVMDAAWHKPWSELEALAARGVEGLSRRIVKTVDRPYADTAYLREGGSKDGNLRGLSLLFMQGW